MVNDADTFKGTNTPILEKKKKKKQPFFSEIAEIQLKNGIYTHQRLPKTAPETTDTASKNSEIAPFSGNFPSDSQNSSPFPGDSVC